MALISRSNAKAKLLEHFKWWNKSGTWGAPYNCGYDTNNDAWVTADDMKVMRAEWEKRSANGYFYRTIPSSSSFTIDFLCHTKKPSDGTSFNYHLKYKA